MEEVSISIAIIVTTKKIGENMNTTLIVSIAACWIASNAAIVVLLLNRNKLKPHVAPTLTDDQADEREKQAEKAKQIHAHFQRLMEYDVDKAQERKYEGG